MTKRKKQLYYQKNVFFMCFVCEPTNTSPLNQKVLSIQPLADIYQLSLCELHPQACPPITEQLKGSPREQENQGALRLEGTKSRITGFCQVHQSDKSLLLCLGKGKHWSQECGKFCRSSAVRNVCVGEEETLLIPSFTVEEKTERKTYFKIILSHA